LSTVLTATVPSLGALTARLGCAPPPTPCTRPTIWLSLTADPSVIDQSVTMPVTGALILIWSPSTWALSVVT
jgi:hypothetical protein